jgi:predicted acetyltransferase
MGERTAYEIVQVTPETTSAVTELDHLTWFDEEDPTDDDPTGALDLDRTFGATRTGRPPFSGIYSWFDQRLTVPAADGGLTQVPCAGLTWVGVHPDDRRTGVLTTMLRHHLDDVRSQGYALGALHASEVGIYGRFGYAQASFDVRVRTSRGAELQAPGVDAGGIHTELVRASAEGVADRAHAVQLAAAVDQLGQVTLTQAHNRRRFRDHPESLRGTEPAKVLFAVRDGQDVGYAMIRRTHKWEDATPQGRLECHDLTAVDPPARLALVSRLVSFDLIASVEFMATSLEDEAIWWLGGPRAAGVRVHDSLWVRVIDVPAALAQRGYASDVDLVLDVDDERCAWNAGRWRLTARDGAATCERTEDEPDVSLPVQALGSAYLGGRSVAAMARQGAVAERTTGSVGALTRAFATEVPPVNAQMF